MLGANAVQVANYIEFGPEESDEDKKHAFAEVVAVGDTCWAKVSEAPDLTRYGWCI